MIALKSSNLKEELNSNKNTDIVSVRIDKADREKQNRTQINNTE